MRAKAFPPLSPLFPLLLFSFTLLSAGCMTRPVAPAVQVSIAGPPVGLEALYRGFGIPNTLDEIGGTLIDEGEHGYDTLDLDDGRGGILVRIRDGPCSMNDAFRSVPAAVVEYRREKNADGDPFLAFGLDRNTGHTIWLRQTPVSRGISPPPQFYRGFSIPNLGWFFGASHFIGLEGLTDGMRVEVDLPGQAYGDGTYAGSPRAWIDHPRMLPFDVHVRDGGRAVTFSLDTESTARESDLRITMDPSLGIPTLVESTYENRPARLELVSATGTEGPRLPGRSRPYVHESNPGLPPVEWDSRGVPPDGTMPAGMWRLSSAIGEATSRSDGLRDFFARHDSAFLKEAVWKPTDEVASHSESWSLTWAQGTQGYAVTVQRTTLVTLEDFAVSSEGPKSFAEPGAAASPFDVVQSVGGALQARDLMFGENVTTLYVWFQSYHTSYTIFLMGPRRDGGLSAEVLPNISLHHDGTLRQMDAAIEWLRPEASLGSGPFSGCVE